jgi:hypothetical protein
MQQLGLEQTPAKSTNRLKGLFWPDIASRQDLDRADRNGFGMCLMSAGVSFTLGPLLAIPGAVFGGLMILLAAFGIRHNRLSAALPLLIIVVSEKLITKHIGGALGLFAVVILLSATRASWLARQFQRDHHPVPPELPRDTTTCERQSDAELPEMRPAAFCVCSAQSFWWHCSSYADCG